MAGATRGRGACFYPKALEHRGGCCSGVKSGFLARRWGRGARLQPYICWRPEEADGNRRGQVLQHRRAYVLRLNYLSQQMEPRIVSM